MEIITQVTKLLQGLLEESMDVVARVTGCVKRETQVLGLDAAVHFGTDHIAKSSGPSRGITKPRPHSLAWT